MTLQSVPGYAGLPIVGDNSLAFYRDPIGFVSKKVKEHQSNIFLTRFLNKPTVFMTSHKHVWELLHDKSENFEMGYKQFMHGIYGDNILFTNGNDVALIKKQLHTLLMSPDLSKDLSSSLESVTGKYWSELDKEGPVDVYNIFKHLSTEICLSCFLDVDFDAGGDLAQRIIALTTTHWHGIISLPLSVTVPMVNKKSTYSKAVEAKVKLVKIIEEKLEQSPAVPGGLCDQMKQQSCIQPRSVINHLLLFTSALVPKAIASLLTSFVLTVANRKEYLEEASKCPEFLECIILEVMRMWPPFVGGRRIAVKSCAVGGYHISAGQSVLFMSHHAHRDADIFIEPNEFFPRRWLNRNADDKEKLFSFGSGPRDCIGSHLVWQIVKNICGSLVKNYTWDIAEHQSLTYKWLPVSRPNTHTIVHFKKRLELT